MKLKEYKIKVWYRFTVNGECEKEYQIFEIISDSLENAIKEALSYFKGHSAIPFKTEILN